jgi:molybdate transport system ATP-binding protein
MSLIVNVRKKFKDFHLHVSFETEGGRLGILGASGSGKTMTLKMIAGIEQPDEGLIQLNGRVLFDSEAKINVSPQHRKVGYLFQQYALFPNMTVSQNIACGLRLMTKEEREQKTIEMLARFQLEEMGNRFPYQLSGGQQQRIALARCLASDPELLLLDEPFSALDAHLREQVTLEMKTYLSAFPGDSIMVSHNRDEIFALCPNLLVLNQGRALAHGGTANLFREPGGFSVAKLTGCKNLSPIKRLDSKTLFASNWNLTLNTNRPIGDEITHVGIRAHDLNVMKPGSFVTNMFPCEVFEIQEGLFETTLLLSTTSEAKEHLWWKIPNGSLTDAMLKDLPNQFTVSPEKLMLLRDDTISK